MALCVTIKLSVLFLHIYVITEVEKLLWIILRRKTGLLPKPKDLLADVAGFLCSPHSYKVYDGRKVFLM